MFSITHNNQLPTTASQIPRVTAAVNPAEKNKQSDRSQFNAGESAAAPEADNRNNSASGLTEAEKQQLQKLQQRDREVRAHEQAHAAAAGSLAKGGPTYEYQRGPDGRQYAVGGSVSIDTSPVEGDPKATLEKAQQIQRAALAPAEPSSQDRAVAAEAAAMAAEARAELARQASQEAVPGSGQTDANFGAEQRDGEEVSADFCAECGGRHASGAHGVSVQLQNTFAESSRSASSVFEAAA